MTTIEAEADETKLKILRDQDMSPVYVILGTAHGIAGQGQDWVNLAINRKLHNGVKCILLPPLSKGTQYSKDIVEQLHKQVKIEEFTEASTLSRVRIRPVRAIYVHDMSNGHIQDDTQHRQLDFTKGLTGRGHDEVVRLVRYGLPPTEEIEGRPGRVEKIQKRWRAKFMKKIHMKSDLIPERDAVGQGEFCSRALDELVQVESQEALRFVKQLNLKGDLSKTDLWKEV
ncbi:hypothetical protein V8F06_010196, partial [Rhypophila decipiens]